MGCLGSGHTKTNILLQVFRQVFRTMFFSPKFLAFENILTEEFWLFPHLTLVTADINMPIKLEIKREHKVGCVYV